MSDRVTHDLGIIGAGVAGLCLARALLDAGGPWSIVLVDGDGDDERFRALSRWSEASTPLDDLVRHRWSRLAINGRIVPLRSHSYQTLVLADLRRDVIERLRRDPRHRIVRGAAMEVTSDEAEARVVVGDETIRVRWAFDSRFRRSELTIDPRRSILLWQRFHGVVLRCETDTFDPAAAVLMDFRVGETPGRAFAYLLPFSPREALAEIVTLGSVGDPEALLRGYLATVHGVGRFEVVARECGASPLTDRPFPPFDGPRVRRIGVAAGRLKPSTGYALGRIVEDSAAIVRSLQRHGHPRVAPPRRPFYGLLDATFLTLWSCWPARMPAVFTAMFGRVSPDRVLRFLDERASVRDALALVARLPLGLFLAALVAYLLRRWKRPARTAPWEGGPREGGVLPAARDGTDDHRPLPVPSTCELHDEAR